MGSNPVGVTVAGPTRFIWEKPSRMEVGCRACTKGKRFVFRSIVIAGRVLGDLVHLGWNSDPSKQNRFCLVSGKQRDPKKAKQKSGS